MNVLFFARYGRLGASSRVRAFQFLPFLESHGCRCVVDSLISDGMLADYYRTGHRSRRGLLAGMSRRVAWLARARQFDVIWIEKELFPYLPVWAERALSWSNVPFVTDYDDAIFHNYDQHRSKLVRGWLGSKIAEIMRRSRVVSVGSDYLGAYARAAGARRIEFLPTVVDAVRYQPKSHDRDTSEFRIGWIGSPGTAKYLSEISAVLSELARASAIRLVVVGPRAVDLPGVPVEVRRWSEATEANEIQTFDVGIMPLPDTPWERGKCGYKLIQYMACGVPVIASPVGANVQIVEQSNGGYLAATPEDWLDSFRRLGDSASLRAELGENGRRFVEEECSVQAIAPRFLAMLREAAGTP